MLELRNIVKFYQSGTVNETCLFNDFSLSIPEKQFVCVVGSNGFGQNLAAQHHLAARFRLTKGAF